jgi:hypothetical protein
VSLIGEDPHDVACLLKMFFAELPEPIFPYKCYERLISVCRHEDAGLRQQMYLAQLKLLPELNAVTVRFLFEFLHTVAMRSGENKMTSANLGVCFGPTLLRPEIVTPEQLMLALEKTIVEHLIDLYPLIFSEIGVREINLPTRQQEEQKNDKSDKSESKKGTWNKKKGRRTVTLFMSAKNETPPPPTETYAPGSNRPLSYHNVDVPNQKSVMKSISSKKLGKLF